MATQDLRMYVLIPRDLEIPVGKLAAQVGHGYLGAYQASLKERPEYAHDYEHCSIHKKVALAVADETELYVYMAKLQDISAPVHLVTDAGLTVFKVPTVTCLGVGPLDQTESEVLKDLKLYK